MDDKTNVMRILDQKKVKYTEYTYLNTDAVGGQEVAEVLGEDANKVFKTLVTCLLYTSPSPRDAHESRMPSSA